MTTRFEISPEAVKTFVDRWTYLRAQLEARGMAFREESPFTQALDMLASLPVSPVDIADPVIKDYLTTCYTEYSDAAINPMPANLKVALDMLTALSAERDAMKASHEALLKAAKDFAEGVLGVRDYYDPDRYKADLLALSGAIRAAEALMEGEGCDAANKG